MSSKPPEERPEGTGNTHDQHAEEHTKSALTRRDALGIMLGASGFIVGLQMLPHGWSKPSVQAAPILQSAGAVKGRKILLTTTTVPPLPVELSTLKALVQDQNVLLTWTTATETNNAGFVVLKASRKGADTWDELGFVEGHATTNVAQYYQYQVVNLAPGRHRFRLKQLDFDGSFAYSEEVEATIELPGVYTLSEGYPNPFNRATSFELTISPAQHVRVEAFNQIGRRVSILYDDLLMADHPITIRFEAGHLSSGVYAVRVVGETFSAVRMVTLVK